MRYADFEKVYEKVAELNTMIDKIKDVYARARPDIFSEDEPSGLRELKWGLECMERETKDDENERRNEIQKQLYDMGLEFAGTEHMQYNWDSSRLLGTIEERIKGIDKPWGKRILYDFGMPDKPVIRSISVEPVKHLRTSQKSELYPRVVTDIPPEKRPVEIHIVKHHSERHGDLSFEGDYYGQQFLVTKEITLTVPDKTGYGKMEITEFHDETERDSQFERFSDSAVKITDIVRFLKNTGLEVRGKMDTTQPYGRDEYHIAHYQIVK